MASRPRSSPAPGSDRVRAGRRPRQGSTGARRTTKVPPPVATGSSPSPSSSRARLTGRAAILLLVVVVLAVSYASSARAWLAQRSDINALHTEIAQRTAAVAALEQASRRWADPTYVEAQARLRFGWVMPGETGYRVIDAQGNVLSGATDSLPQPSAAGAASEPTWWQREWGTVVEAGREPTARSKTSARKAPHQIGAARKGGDAHPRHRVAARVAPHPGVATGRTGSQGTSGGHPLVPFGYAGR